MCLIVEIERTGTAHQDDLLSTKRTSDSGVVTRAPTRSRFTELLSLRYAVYIIRNDFPLISNRRAAGGPALTLTFKFRISRGLGMQGRLARREGEKSTTMSETEGTSLHSRLRRRHEHTPHMKLPDSPTVARSRIPAASAASGKARNYFRAMYGVSLLCLSYIRHASYFPCCGNNEAEPMTPIANQSHEHKESIVDLEAGEG